MKRPAEFPRRAVVLCWARDLVVRTPVVWLIDVDVTVLPQQGDRDRLVSYCPVAVAGIGLDLGTAACVRVSAAGKLVDEGAMSVRTDPDLAIQQVAMHVMIVA